MLCLRKLLVKRLGRVELEGQSRFSNRDGGRLLTHLFSLQVALQRVEEQSVVRYTVPVEDLLLLLRADTVVLVQEVEEGALGLFQRCIGTGLQIP